MTFLNLNLITLSKYQKKIGYCPQTDPLVDEMTVLETLLIYSRIKGIKNELIMNACLSLIDLFELNEHKNKMCYTLSGGNKRILSVAISLIGIQDKFNYKIKIYKNFKIF